MITFFLLAHNPNFVTVEFKNSARLAAQLSPVNIKVDIIAEISSRFFDGTCGMLSCDIRRRCDERADVAEQFTKVVFVGETERDRTSPAMEVRELVVNARENDRVRPRPVVAEFCAQF